MTADRHTSMRCVTCSLDEVTYHELTPASILCKCGARRTRTPRRRYTSPHSDAVRPGSCCTRPRVWATTCPAARLDTPTAGGVKWRKRFYDERLIGLTDLLGEDAPEFFPLTSWSRLNAAVLRTAALTDHAACSLAVP